MTNIPFRIEPDTSPGDAALEREPPRDGRIRLTVRLGTRRTGGHSIAVTRITRAGATLSITCDVRAPRPGDLLTQVLTSPRQTVSVDEGVLTGVGLVVLTDQTGTEVARINA